MLAREHQGLRGALPMGQGQAGRRGACLSRGAGGVRLPDERAHDLQAPAEGQHPGPPGDSDDELPRRTNLPDSDDPEQEAAPRLTRKKKEGAEYDDSRPAAEVADEINEIITELHGEKGGKGEEEGPEAPKGKKKASYKVKPTGWTSSAVEVLAVLVGMTWSGARDGAAMRGQFSDSTFNGPTLKNPLAQGITRIKATSWTLLDSLNVVYPIAMREAVAFQSNDYYAYQHELGDAGNVPQTYEYLTSTHRMVDIYHYWTTNGARFLVPFVRTTLSRHMFMMIRHYLHFADARKKVLRGDRSMPAPPGYDPIYNFRPLMDGFNTAWSSAATLSEYLTIDEKMIKLAMHIGLSRRQPNKPIRDGLQASRARPCHAPPHHHLSLHRSMCSLPPRATGSTTHGLTKVRGIQISSHPTTLARRSRSFYTSSPAPGSSARCARWWSISTSPHPP